MAIEPLNADSTVTGAMANLPEDFDATTYLQLNPDLVLAKVDPIQHYLMFGRLEGRRYTHNITAAFLDRNVPGPKIALLGSCVAARLDRSARNQYAVYHFLYRATPSAALPKIDLGLFDAIVVHLAMRDIFDVATDGNGDLFHLRADTNYAEVIHRSASILRKIVGEVDDTYGNRRPIFFLAFIEPPPTNRGFLANSRKDSLYHCVRTLNDSLADLLSSKANIHYLEINDLRTYFGDANSYDGYTNFSTHGAFLELPSSDQIHHAILDRVQNSLNSLNESAKIKLIITDLDNTLWKGVLAEEDEIIPELHTEGWPLAYAEALLEFKRRGGLLAICSKNSYDKTVTNFEKVWSGRISLSDFCVIKINWESKSENITQILNETGLLPQNVLFVDDNPRELADVLQSFPEIKVLSGNPTRWKRMIIYSPETQSKSLTDESKRRTELIQAKILRDDFQKKVSRENYLYSLQLKLDINIVNNPTDIHIERSVELINKTNQFNTTGKRWSNFEIGRFFREKGFLLSATAEDKFGKHGIIAVALISGCIIEQIVMSCRIFGLGIEDALLNTSVELILDSCPQSGVRARFSATGKNHSCENWIHNLGFPIIENEFVDLRTAVKFRPSKNWINLRVFDCRSP